MYKQANISFFESLGNARGNVVIYDQDIQNGFWDGVKTIAGNIRDAWTRKSLGVNRGDPRMLTLFHLMNAPIRRIRGTLYDIQCKLMYAVKDGSTDTDAMLTYLDGTMSQLKAMFGEYDSALRQSHRYLNPPVRKKRTPPQP